MIKLDRYLIHLIFYVNLFCLLTAWIIENILGIEPCLLCLYQRYITILLILSAGLGVFILPAFNRFWPIWTCFTLLVGQASFAAYHVAVENKWIYPFTSCQTAISAGSIEDLHQALMAQPYAPCDVVAFDVLGISLSGYNFFISCFLILCVLYVHFNFSRIS